MRTYLGGRLASIRERFFDNFTRPNSVGLGAATDGSNWTPVSGALNISNNVAVSPNSVTNYPMSTVDMPTVNNSIELKGTGQGSSAAIWVQGSSDWHLVGQDQVQTSFSYSYNYNYSYTYWSYSYITSYPLGTYYTYSYQYFYIL